MPNAHVVQRLSGIQTILNGVHQSSVGLSSATKGTERAAFIDQFLNEVLPPVYRFGTGDATDTSGVRSGQLDVVVEYPFAPSLPVVGAAKSRLYLAECIAAVIEVKSDLAGQWNDALATAAALAPLNRAFGGSMSFGPPPAARIPLFAVGYVGWKTLASVKAKVDAAPAIDGALVIDAGIYYSKSGIQAEGPLALWGLIVDLSQITNSLASATVMPAQYAV